MHRPDYLKSSHIRIALSLSVYGPGILYNRPSKDTQNVSGIIYI